MTPAVKWELPQVTPPPHPLVRLREMPDVPGMEPNYTLRTRGEWLMGPCAYTGDPDPFAQCNFDVLTERLDEADPYGLDWIVLVWNHFGSEFMTTVFVRPGTLCDQVCSEARETLLTELALDESRMAAQMGWTE